MSFWPIMNGIAWALCALFAYLIISDFIKVEKKRYEENKNKKENMKGQV